MRVAFSFFAASTALVSGALLSCQDVGGDVSATKKVLASCRDKTLVDGEPSAVGGGLRIAQVTNPKELCDGHDVNVTGAVVLAVDEFDETLDGKSRGTIYVQDLDSQAPFGGVSLFSPTFIPNNLRVSAGDVLDLQGLFVETKKIGTTVDFKDESLPQLSQPIGTFRFDAALPQPLVIPATDLAAYDSGRRWLGMLVRVENVTLTAAGTSNKGRVTAPISGTGLDAPTVTNELYDLPVSELTAGRKWKSVTGVVTYFFNFHVSPRSPADFVE